MEIRLITNGLNGQIGNGMDLYRLVMPYYNLTKDHNILCVNGAEFDSTQMDGDLYVINRSRDMWRAKRIITGGKKLVIDIDDYWKIPSWHPMSQHLLKKQLNWAAKNMDKVDKKELEAVQYTYERECIAEFNSMESCKMASLVTVSTPLLQETIYKEHGIYAEVIPNSILPEISMFTTKKMPSRLLRFGWVGGVHHRRDVALMYNGLKKATQDKKINGSIQFLSTFNNNTDYIEIERMFTQDYKICDSDYADYLKQYTNVGKHFGNNKPYQRLWSLSPQEYGIMYENIDVALIPLQSGKLNSHKSELKLVEAGMTGCAAIVSNVMPYQPFLKHGINCLVANGTDGWYNAIRFLTENPHEVKRLAWGLSQTIKENFDNKTISSKLSKLVSEL